MREIMKRAWALAREAGMKFGMKASLFFKESLKIAWSEFKYAFNNHWSNNYNKPEKKDMAISFGINTLIRLTEETIKLVAELKSGIKTVSYYDYKGMYSNCKTVEGSYDKKTKTIKIYA